MLFKSIVYAVPFLLLGSVSYGQEFPLTLQHTYGETVIPAKPERIVTWGWGAQDAVIALGEVPVGIPYFTYGGDEDGALAWTKQAIAELGAEFPETLSQTGGVPYEAIAALAPDVILAVHSGITQDEYARLSQIAPVVAYSGKPWGTTWQDTIKVSGQAIGKATEAEALVAELEQFIVDETAKYPQVQGASFAGISNYEGAIAVFSDFDSRITFLQDAGLVIAPSVSALGSNDVFYYSLSYERANELTSDILITYTDSPADTQTFLALPGMVQTAQVKSGAVASISSQEMNNAISPPSALSLKWGYPEYIRLIGEAVSKGKAKAP